MAGVAIVSKLFRDVASSRLAASPDSTFATGVVYSSDEPTDDRVVRHEIEDLNADTEYFYRLEIEGVLQGRNQGRFRTKPDSPASFKFAFSSCARSGSDHPVFDEIREIAGLLFFIHLGDIHYENIAVNDDSVFEAAFDMVLRSPRQNRFFRDLPVQYMWDDHDYGPNNSDGTATGRDASVRTFRRRVPHPPLVLSGETDAPYHSFAVGRCRFVVTDLRSERTPNSATDNSSKTMMGATQKQWFKDELLAAKSAEQFVFWVRTSPWLIDSGADYSFFTERTEIADFIKANDLSGRMAILTADRHALAIDDGTGGDYATGGGAPVPSFMASPLDQSNFGANGTYSEGEWNDNENMYGVVEVTDAGGATITIDWRGYGYGEGELVHYQFTANLAA